MTRSLINQLTQIGSSSTYVDTLSSGILLYAEQTGRNYAADTFTTASGATTIVCGTALTDEEIGNFIVMDSGAAAGMYEITDTIGTNATVSVAPTATVSGVAGRKHYNKNLEDDFSFIRTALVNIKGENDWYLAPTASLSDLQDQMNLITVSGATDHGVFTTNLDYASAGHTGFQASGDYALNSKVDTASGTLQAQFDNLDVTYASDAELAAVSGTLQTQITSNDSDISTLDTKIDTTSGTLQTQFDNLDITYATDAELTSVSGVLQTQITSNDGDISTLDTKVDTTSGTLQTQITSNDSDISTLDTKVDTTSGTLQTDIIWEVADTPTEQIRPKAAHIGKAIWTPGNLTIGGNFTVSGTTTTVNSEELTVVDKTITVNYGETGAGITGTPLAGIEVDRGSETNYLFMFDEIQDNFSIGISGSLQAVATREDSPTDGNIAVWDSGTVRFNASLDPSTLATDIELATTASGLQTQITSNDSDISTLDTKVDTTSGTLQTQINATSFSGLTDTPSAYTGQKRNMVVVNEAETALEFNDLIRWNLHTRQTFVIGEGSAPLYTSTDTADANIVIGTDVAPNAPVTDDHEIYIGYGVREDAVGDQGKSDYNTFIGPQAATKFETGGNNIFIGEAAGWNVVSGEYNILIGPSVYTLTDTPEGEIVIGIGNQGHGDYTATIGDDGNEATYLYGTIHINDDVEIAMDGSSNLTFTDIVAGTKTLAELAADTTDHAVITGSLDYASAGHTGFQASGDYALNSKVDTASGTLQTQITTHGNLTNNPHTVTLEQARTAGNQLSGDVDFNNNSIVDLEALNFNIVSGTAQIYWDEEDYCAYIDNGLGHALHVGRDSQIEYLNNTGSTIPIGTVLSVAGAAAHPGNGRILLTPILPKADRADTFGRNIMISTHEVLNNESGVGTHFGKIYNMDTSAWSQGDALYVSSTVSGTLTNVAPVYPDFTGFVGTVLEVHGTLGKINIDPTININDTIHNFFNGVIMESFDFRTASNGTVISGTLTNPGSYDYLTLKFSDGTTILDVTSLSIVLTPGTDTNPQENFVYIPISTKVLTVGSSYPSEEYIKIANVVLQSASMTVGMGALVNRNINDHLAGTNSQGHLSHITEKLRKFEAQWDTGAEATISGLPTNAYVHVTEGIVYQMHQQTFPVFSMPTNDIHVINDSVAPYTTITDLISLTADAVGGSLNNTSFSLVVWGVANKTGEPSHLMCNLPTGTYSKNTPENATADAFNYSVYSIPRAFQGTGFLIARFTFVNTGGTWSLHATEDLRGKIPNTSAGGGAGGTGVTTFLGLTDTPSAFGTEGQVPMINAGTNALEFQSLTGLDYEPTGTAATLSGVLQPQITSNDGDISTLDTKIDTTSGTLQAEIDGLGGGGDLLADGTVPLTADWQIGENAITLDATLTASGTYSGMTISGTVGEQIEPGEIVYLKSDGKWWLSDKDTEATIKGAVMMALESKAADETSKLLLNGMVRFTQFDTPLTTTGVPLFIGVAGIITETPSATTGDFNKCIGHVMDHDLEIIWFNPSTDWVEV